MTLTLAEQAERAIRIVQEQKEPIAYDTETSGLDWKRNKAVGYVITGDALHNFYIPVRHGGGGNLYDPTVPPLTTSTDDAPVHYFEHALARAFALRSEQARATGQFLTIGHNLKFDMHMSANQGIILGRYCEDTSVNEPMLDENQRSFSLENCALRRGVTPKKGEVLYEHMSRVLGIPLTARKAAIMEHFWRLAGNNKQAVDYACGDGITTLQLRDAQYPLLMEVDDAGTSQEYIHGVESKLIYTLFRMERRGWKVDVDYVRQLRAAIAEELAEAKKALPEGFNERSPKQTMEVMRAAGVTNWPTTPSGNPSFTEKFLKQSVQGRAIVNLRQMANLESKFVGPLLNDHLWQGRVHAQLNQMKMDDLGAGGGRLSCSDPNLQAVTKRNKKLGPRFRKCFVFDEGMEGFEDDYSQCEPRLFAHYSREPALVDGYSRTPPLDMHHVVAENFGVERDPTAKRMNMGILTGMQVKTFAEHMEWPLDRAHEQFNAWFRLFPGIKAFQNGAKRNMIDRGYVRTLTGRRCRVEDNRFAYKATSRIIQGSNADVIKVKLLEIDMWLEDHGDVGHLIMTIHDSIIGQVPKGPVGGMIRAEIIRIATDVQCAPFHLRVPFIMDEGVGPNWAVCTYGADTVREVTGS